MYVLENALRRRGFTLVAGADEAGRGACAGPLVVAAAILPDGARGQIAGLTDSKLLTERAREDIYAQVVDRAVAHAIVVISPAEVDRLGVGASNLSGMRRALARLDPMPAYALTDGFPVPGLPVPGLGVWKGDRVAACVAAASVLAKVTRDRIMTELEQNHPGYGFAEHKGYGTAAHTHALRTLGPCPQHRLSYANVVEAVSGNPRVAQAAN
ncbi:Ribonuclease H [Stackebrandtia nassauensis DSM 44728]|uniref:Ribonuclease HII n=1 Tax=Stackebrandtia nassauensis (strain DSM 44728 / CIP 108903 / NRRL B-16338 / NBRC 102104 / LLR-40K-21) TaxID=446470 RepID=D3Q214_STANL|nr:Ribonuclease H [Stackebrandtia nassauensis DSM 44728]